MGAKTGYASEILALFGLTAGQGADAYLWCEPDDGARTLLQALPQPDVLKEAAAILRGWKDEEPRALWERLRAEGPIRGCDGGEVARWCFLLGSNPLIPGTFSNDGRWVNAARDGGIHTKGGVTFGGEFCTNPGAIGDVIHALPTMPRSIIASDARAVDPKDLPDGTVCFIDPPYVSTTGYKHDLGRAEVVDLAVKWADAGAFVGVSEQAPIEELTALGWHVVNLTNGRKGQKRTFSKQQEEWVTLSRPPVNVPLLGSQPSLFGGTDAR